MKEEFVIIGGGMAGLCAANRLVELGASPLLIEAGDYPAHKICGEFISTGSMKILEQWGIQPKIIEKACFRTPQQELHYSFKNPAGSLSHLQLDPALAQRAQKRGAFILTNTKVIDIHITKDKTEDHLLELSNGTTLQAKHLLIATGRIPSLPQVFKPQYIGFKAHFQGFPASNTLEMFSIPGAYLGSAPIEEGKFNVAALTTHNSVQATIDHFINQHPLLKSTLNAGKNLFSEWMETPVPEFGINHTPQWPRVYFIGDAAATIPPASGNGISLAIQCGHLAAAYAVQDDERGFKKAWKQQIRAPIYFAKLLHRMMLNPTLGNKAIALNRFLPLANIFFHLTR